MAFSGKIDFISTVTFWNSRETIHLSVSNSFSYTWCTPHGNATLYHGPSDLPSIIRHIEFYAWIGVWYSEVSYDLLQSQVYIKVPVISGLLFRSFMILSEEREAIYFGKVRIYFNLKTDHRSVRPVPQ